MSEVKCPKCGAEKSQKMSSQREIVYKCNSLQYIGTTVVPFIQSDLCKKMESRNDKQNVKDIPMGEVKCPKCGAEKAIIGGCDITYACGTIIVSSALMERETYTEFCRGRADAIRELTEWRTGEPPEGVDVVLVNDTDYGAYTVMIRDSGELWSLGVGRVPWKKMFVWLPIPQ